MIHIRFNGIDCHLPENTSIDSFLNTQTKLPSVFATALNDVFIPKNQRTQTILHDHDILTLFSPITGG